MTEEQYLSIMTLLREHTAAMQELHRGQALLRQDVTLLRNGQGEQIRMLIAMARDVRMLKTGLNDLGRENVTPGEISAVHDDLDRLRADYMALAARVGAMESKQGGGQ